MAEDDLLRISTRDGKYTVIQQAGGGMRFARHGEELVSCKRAVRARGIDPRSLAQDLEAANKVAEAAERFWLNTDRMNWQKSIDLQQALEEWNQDRKKGK
jgi:hypothetical protein